MAVSPYIYNGGILGAAAAIQGAAVPAATKRIIRAANLTNTTAAPIAATVYLVPDGGSPGAANTFLSGRPIAAGESYPCPELIGLGLRAGGAVQALGNGLTFNYTATDFV